MRIFYTFCAYLLAPVVCGVLLWRGFRDRSYWSRFSERFGFGERMRDAGSIWVHAVSVGEVQAAAPLVKALRANYPDSQLVLTTVTPTGAQRARDLFGGDVHVRYVCYDLPGAVRRFFARVRPRIAIIIETELWPNLYHGCGRRGIPLVLASARISPRSVGRYRLLAGLFRETLSHGIVIAAQSEDDAARFRSIGANSLRTHVTGNIKFDFELPADVVSRGAALRARHARERPVWVAGSTHAGEEEIILEAHSQLRASGVDALLILVPRHPNRFREAANLLERRGVSFVRRSSDANCAASTAVLLGDSLGELIVFYAAGDIAFVGGSLVPIGGHNLLEPAALGRPVIAGPYSFNAEDVAQLLIDAHAVQVVHDAPELCASLTALFADQAARTRAGEAGRGVLQRNRGAVQRLLDLLRPVLSGR